MNATITINTIFGILLLILGVWKQSAATDVSCYTCTAAASSEDCYKTPDFGSDSSGPLCYATFDASTMKKGPCTSYNCKQERATAVTDSKNIFICSTRHCNAFGGDKAMNFPKCNLCAKECQLTSTVKAVGLSCFAAVDFFTGEIVQGACTLLDCSEKLVPGTDIFLVTTTSDGNAQTQLADFSGKISCYECKGGEGYCDNKVDIRDVNQINKVTAGVACIAALSKIDWIFYRKACQQANCTDDTEHDYYQNIICSDNFCNNMSFTDLPPAGG